MNLAGKGLAQFLTKNLGPVTKSVLPGTALNTGFGLLTGGPVAGLTFAATDFATSVPATLLGRYAARNIKNKNLRGLVEGAANVAGSLTGTELGSNILMGGQQQQIAQQIEQRSAINQLPLYEQIGDLAPGTQYQTTGLPSSQPFEELLNQMPRNSWMQYLDSADQAMLQGVINPRL